MGGNKVEKKKNLKPIDKEQKANSLKSGIAKPKEKRKKSATKTTIFKPALTKVKEPVNNKLSQRAYKDKITNRECIKCSEKGHIWQTVQAI